MIEIDKLKFHKEEETEDTEEKIPPEEMPPESPIPKSEIPYDTYLQEVKAYKAGSPKNKWLITARKPGIIKLQMLFEYLDQGDVEALYRQLQDMGKQSYRLEIVKSEPEEIEELPKKRRRGKINREMLKDPNVRNDIELKIIKFVKDNPGCFMYTLRNFLQEENIQGNLIKPIMKKLIEASKIQVVDQRSHKGGYKYFVKG